MSGRGTYRLAWCIWALVVLLTAITLVLQVKNAPSAWLVDSVNSLILLAFATVGCTHRVAPSGESHRLDLLCQRSLWVLGIFGEEYAVYALFTAPGSLPAGALAGGRRRSHSRGSLVPYPHLLTAALS